MDEYIDAILAAFDPEPPKPPSPSKRCSVCSLDKDLSCFGKRGSGLSAQCKPCVNAAQRKRLASGYARTSKLAAQRKWAENNKDKIQEKQRRYLNTSNRRAAERRKTDLNYRFASAMRNRINSALAGKIKSAPTLRLLGCDLDYLRDWIASQFDCTMTWNNYGAVWEFDHVRPCQSFDLTDPTSQGECFCWKNMRPMSRRGNRSKNATPPSVSDLTTHEQRAAEWLALHPNPFSIHGNNLKD